MTPQTAPAESPTLTPDASLLAAVESPLSAQVGFLLFDVLGASERSGCLHLTGRDDSGFSDRTLAASLRDFHAPWLPKLLARALIDDVDICWGVDLRIHKDAAPVRLASLAAQWRLAPVDGGRTGRDQRVPLARVAEIRHRIDAWAFRPAAIVLGGVPEGGCFSLTAIYRLAEPLPLDTQADRAVALLERLAATLGAAAPAPPSIVVPLPGARIRGVRWRHPYTATVLHVDSEAVTNLAALEEVVR